MTTETRTIHPPAPRAPETPAEAGTATAAAFPLTARFPALATIPRVAIARRPTPVERVEGFGRSLWVKREDLATDDVGGNKVRALEFLLAWVRPGDHVITVGARGSTHALATAVHASRLGARTTVVRWKQEMNRDAERTSARLAAEARVVDVATPVDALLIASLLRLAPRTRWVPAGGTSPLGMLGHVNAGLELAAQITAGLLPAPARIVVPYGTGGTAAGLALGLAIARIETELVCVRVVPRIVGNGPRLHWLVRRAARLIGGETGEPVRLPSRNRLRIVHEAYAGAYGRPFPDAGDAAARLLESAGIVLDDTYSAKAFAIAHTARDDGPTLFWLTFDARWMRESTGMESDARPHADLRTGGS